MSAPGTTTTNNAGNLFAQLATLDAEFFANAVTTTHNTLKGDVAATLIASAPTTLEAAHAATAPLLASAVAKAPTELQPILSAFGVPMIHSLTTNLFNWGFGKLFGSYQESQVESSENAAGITG